MARRVLVARFQGPCKRELIRSASTNLTLKESSCSSEGTLPSDSWGQINIPSSDTERSRSHSCFQCMQHSALFSLSQWVCPITWDGVPKHPLLPQVFHEIPWWPQRPFFLRAMHRLGTSELNTSYAWSCEIRKVCTFHPCMPGTRSFTWPFRTEQLDGHKPPSLFFKRKETAETGNELGVNYLSGLNASKKVERGLSGNSTFWKSQQSRKCCKCHMIVL